MSPFVDNDAEGYVPDYAETIKRLQATAKNQVLPLPGVGKEDLEDPQALLAEGVIDRAEANEAAERKKKARQFSGFCITDLWNKCIARCRACK